jgi:hypothetical protein
VILYLKYAVLFIITFSNSGGIAIVYVVIKHRVEDYSKWKPVFDEDASRREKAGCKGWQLFHSLDNPNEITIILE